MAEAAELEQDHLESLKVLGYFYLRLGLAERAERLFAALTALIPGDAQAALSLAAARLEAGRPGEALALFDRPPLSGPEAGGLTAEAARLLKARSLWRLGRREETFALLERGPSAGSGAGA
ncbi:MAG: hypothetical protein LBV21_00640 [Candidatus Adiutrix sp.]|jgi:tetratricopeptide (TPR) repeat protein|nr:hypothetical protein [Candidatus Adiutrix sp.]